jgi:hypothetical protein
MKAIKRVRGHLIAHPNSESGKILRSLVTALGEDREFVLTDLYRLDFEDFELALALLGEWRLDRHYASRLALFDAATMGIAPNVERRKKPRP